jgi:2-methylaconitate cis-trans-isomerase PrpF
VARELNCGVYRGGNSKTLIFRDEDLPETQEERDRIFLYAIGCPDPVRLNGLGGSTINQNKVVILSKPKIDGVDIEYTLGQIGLTEPCVEYSYNSGNIAFAVALYAAHNGVIDPDVSDQELKIYNTNAKERINAKFVSFDKEPGGAEIKLDFLAPGGGVTGSLFPTGRPMDDVRVAGGTLKATVIDAGNLTVLIDAAELGLTGAETSESQVAQVFGVLEEVATEVARQFDLPVKAMKTIIVARPKSYESRKARMINQSDINLCARDITLGSFHPGFPVTGAIAVSIAALAPGTLANQLADLAGNDGMVRIGTPSGVFEIGASVSNNNGEVRAEKITLVDSARAIMQGKAWVP